MRRFKHLIRRSETGQSGRRALLATLVLVTLFSTLFSGGNAHADEVKLKSGKVRNGKVISEDEQFVILETRLGRLRIPVAEIESVSRREDASADGNAGTETGGGEAPDKPAPDAGARPGRPGRRAIVRRAPRKPKPEPAVASDETAPTAPPETIAPTATETETQAERDRLSQLRRSRVVRRTKRPVADEPEKAVAKPAPKATIGGMDLAKVPEGTEVIVFQPPRPFAAAKGAIEIGARLVARMEMAGVKSAWMTVPGPDGTERVAVRLADVKRHIDISEPNALLRIFEGIKPGDWVRIQLRDGTTLQGGLEGVADGAARLIGRSADGRAQRHAIRVSDVVRVDGLILDASAHRAISVIEPDELVAVTYWPDGKQVLGRFVEGGGADVLSIDLDDDGTADRKLMRSGPVAELRRVPPRHRDAARKLRAGDVVRLTFVEEFPEAAVRRNHIGRIAAMTAFNLSVEDGRDVMVVPFRHITDLVVIENRPDAEIRKWNAKMAHDDATLDFALLPGTKVAKTRASSLPSGVTTLDNGRIVTQVFISTPFSEETFGVRVGEPVLQAVRRSQLRFHTTVMPRVRPGAEPEAQQTISESIEGVRFVILGDDLGIVTGIEMSRRD